MKARRGGTAAGRWAAATLGAVALAGTLSTATATAAQAQARLPTYRCARVEIPHGSTVAAGEVCSPVTNDAPVQGHIPGSFRIESSRGSVYCEDDFYHWSYAELPEFVLGAECRWE